uniref:HDC04819 n=1 Tax=Drosophila melanogaster TaxID=7227 RepID=Q6IGW4_DROME|nr:TPA_inf: HDC04819 [Drosophila melanogaster]
MHIERFFHIKVIAISSIRQFDLFFGSSGKRATVHRTANPHIRPVRPTIIIPGTNCPPPPPLLTNSFGWGE